MNKKSAKPRTTRTIGNPALQSAADALNEILNEIIEKREALETAEETIQRALDELQGLEL